jgi:hypothetical protein
MISSSSHGERAVLQGDALIQPIPSNLPHLVPGPGKDGIPGYRNLKAWHLSGQGE